VDVVYLIYCLAITSFSVGAVLISRNASAAKNESRDRAWWISTIASCVLATPTLILASLILIGMAAAAIRGNDGGGTTGVGLTPGLAYPLLYSAILGIPLTMATAILLIMSPVALPGGTRMTLKCTGLSLAILLVLGWVVVRIYCLPE
jgi:hypothetical protein